MCVRHIKTSHTLTVHFGDTQTRVTITNTGTYVKYIDVYTRDARTKEKQQNRVYLKFDFANAASADALENNTHAVIVEKFV